MRSKLDQLLSPERLRARWGETAKAPEASEAKAPAERAPPAELVVKIRALVEERFPGRTGQAKAVPLLRLVDDLEKVVGRRFPVEGEMRGDEAARAEQDARIDQLLASLEDLLEVAAMGSVR